MQMTRKKLRRANTEVPTQIWNFCARFSDVFGGETSRNVAKCRLFSQAMPPPPPWPLHYLDDWKQFHLGNEVTAIASHRIRESCHKPLKTLYVLTKTLCNERSRQGTTVLDKNGNLISSKREVKARWTEYVKEVLNTKASANPIIDDQEDDLHITQYKR